jgi:hypothetical protein
MKRGGSLTRHAGANDFTSMPARAKPMTAGPFPLPRTSLSRSGGTKPRPNVGHPRLRHRSKKTAKVYRDERIPLTQKMLAEAGYQCGIRWDDRCRGQADALHEILPRGRGGSIVDEANCVPACNPCNEAVSSNPAEAEKRGLLRKSGRPSKAVPR